jgi:hypothetical protein
MTRRLLPALAVLAAVASCTSRSEEAADPGPCVADALEPNDDPRARASFGMIQDDDDLPGQGGEPVPKRIRRDLTVHSSADVDWFDVDVRDTGVSGNPGISVIVSDGFEATAWWSCASGASSVVCGLGSAVTDDPELTGRGCATKVSQPAGSAPPQLTMRIECDGTATDDGTLHVRVRPLEPVAACTRYALTVMAD